MVQAWANHAPPATGHVPTTCEVADTGIVHLPVSRLSATLRTAFTLAHYGARR
jgi:hypothetical protein